MKSDVRENFAKFTGKNFTDLLRATASDEDAIKFMLYENC